MSDVRNRAIAIPFFILLSLLATPGASFIAREGTTKVVIRQMGQTRATTDAITGLIKTESGEVIHEYVGEILVGFPTSRISSVLARAAAIGVEVRPRDDFDKIYLSEGIVDARLGLARSLPHIPTSLPYPKGSSGLFLLQFAGPSLPEWETAVTTLGVRLVQYLPYNAYVAVATPEAVTAAAKLAFVQFIEALPAGLKTHPRVGNNTEAADYLIRLVDAPGVDEAIRSVERFAIQRSTAQTTSGPVTPKPRAERLSRTEFGIQETVDPRDLPNLLANPLVYSVLHVPVMQMSDERVSLSLTQHVDGAPTARVPVRPESYKTWLANICLFCSDLLSEGFRAGVADPSGVDGGPSSNLHNVALSNPPNPPNPPNAPKPKITYSPDYGAGASGYNSHGTMIAGVIAGDPPDRSTVPPDPSHPYLDKDFDGFFYGTGVAPSAGIYVNRINSYDPAAVTKEAAQQGLSVQNHSYNEYIGSNTPCYEGTYTATAQNFDKAAIDDENHLPMLLTVSAGNASQQIKNSLCKDWVVPPGTAKNVISVGSSEVPRSIQERWECHLCGQDSFDDIAANSTRGTSKTGWFKPDVFAPAENIASTRSTGDQRTDPNPTDPYNVQCDNTGQAEVLKSPDYLSGGGTSFAAPVAAGAALLASRFYAEHIKPNCHDHLSCDPRLASPALIKAMLIAGATSMAGGIEKSLERDSAGNVRKKVEAPKVIGAFPNSQQGFGRLNLENVLSQSISRYYLNETIPLSLGQEFVAKLYSVDPSRPIKLALAWSDPPADVEEIAAPDKSPLVNDLDLWVEIPGTATTPCVRYVGNRLDITNSARGEEAIGYDCSDATHFDVMNNVEVSQFFLPRHLAEFDVHVRKRSGPENTSQKFALVAHNACSPPRRRAVAKSIDDSRSASSVGAGTVVHLSVDFDPEVDQGDTIVWFAQTSQGVEQIGMGAEVNHTAITTTEYFAEITNICGIMRTASVLVEVCKDKVKIAVQPVSVSVAYSGTPVSVTTQAQATGTPVYEWYEGASGNTAVRVSGTPGQVGLSAVGNTVTLKGGPGAKTVWARAFSCGDYVDSASVTLEITACPPPVVVGVAYGGELLQGEGTQFLVMTDEPRTGETYTYQWYRGSDNQPIPGATGIRLAAATGTFETFYCVVTNHCSGGSISSTTSSLGYLWQRGVCDFPPLSTSQSADDIASNGSIVFTAFDDWPDVTFEWYEGEAGDTRKKAQADAGAPNRLTVYQPVGRPHLYWVRASLACGAFHDSATLTFRKNGCTAIQFAPQPQSANIASGQSVTLFANTPFANPPVSAFNWYKIENGGVRTFQVRDFSLPLASVTTTARYLVSAANNCSDVPNADFTEAVDSQIATIRVASCGSVPVTQWPADAWVDESQRRTLSVTADDPGNSLTYHWYKGEVGDETDLIANETASSLLTEGLSQSATYWVRASNSTCSADSPTIHVSVCVPPHIATSIVDDKPVISRFGAARLSFPVAGTNVTYQWYVGALGTLTNPFGISTDTVRVSLISDTTKFWVRATTHCSPADPEKHLDHEFTVNVRPPITQQPVAAVDPVMPGLTTTLTANGGLPSASFQWYIGEIGDTANPFGGNSLTVTTPPITVDTKFWLRLRSGDAYTDSDTVTVHLCAPPPMNWMTANPALVQSGTQVTMTFAQPEDGSVIVWYQGVSGDLAHSTLIGPSSFPYFQTAPLTQTTSYWARVTKGSCWSDTSTFTVSVCVPVITQPVASALINAGQSATLTIGATPSTATYQWYIGQSGDTSHPISSATSSSYVASPSATTSYWVRVSGSCGTPADSTTATVTICQPPAIQSTAISSNIGTSFSIAQGQSASCSVIANGTNLTYQWYTGVTGNTSSPITGGNGSLVTVTPQDTTSYWVRITGACGTANSATLTVSVCAVPVITTQPQSVTIFSGAATTLSIATTEGTSSAVTYQWYRGNSGDQSAPVGTGAAFTTPALTTATSYWARASCGVCNPVNSQTATVSICPIAANLASPGDVNIAIGQIASLSTVTGTGNTYQWYTGASGNTSQSAGCATSSCSFSPAVTTSYWCRVTNGTCVSSTPSGTVYVCIPTITAHPQSIMINPGASTTLTVAANTPGLTYQWYVGTSGTTTSPLSGQTGASLTVTPSSATNYWVRVTGTCGQSANSNTAAVTICQIPSMTVPVPVQSIVRGQSVTISVNPSGTNLTYQWYIGPAGNVAGSAATGTATSSITVSPQDTTAYWVRITGTCGTANSTAITVNVCAAPTITSQPQSVSIFSGATATLSVAASEATSTSVTYQWYRGTAPDTSASMGTASSFTTPALTAATNYWVRLSCGVCSPVDSQTATVAMCPYPASLASPGSFNIALGQTAHLTTVTGAGNSYQWYAGATGNTSQPVSAQSAIDVAPTATTSYWCRVQNGTCVSSTQTATVNVCIPAFTQQPASTTITAGSSTTLTSAANTSGVTYQWYSGASGNTASPVTNGTNANLTVSPSSTTNYWVRATGSCGVTTDSATATVNICQPPVITAQPQNANPVNYNGVTYVSVSATGSNLTYQWYYGESGNTSALVTGVTGPTYSYAIQSTLRLWVRVSGQCGSIDSAAVFASVYPTISVQPEPSLTVGYNSTASTTLYMQTGSYLHYVWKWGNGTPVPGAPDSPTLITPSITSNSYAYCEISSGTAVINSYGTSMTICYDQSPINSMTKGYGYVYISTPFAYDYKWYQGARGDVSHLVASGASVLYASPSTPTQYWCRVISSSTGTEPTCYNDSDVVTLP